VFQTFAAPVIPATRRDRLSSVLLVASLYVPLLSCSVLSFCTSTFSSTTSHKMAEASSSENVPLLHSRQSSVDETDTTALPAPELEQSATVDTDSLGLGGDATNDPDVEAPKTSFNDFWTWFWKILVVKMFGRNKFQVLCSSLLFLVSLGMLITQFINQSSQIKLSFNVLALCLCLIFLGNNSLTNHDLVSRSSLWHMQSLTNTT